MPVFRCRSNDGFGCPPRLQFFGQAEVDAACLFSLDRDIEGNVLYHPRDGVRVVLGDARLGLMLVDDGPTHWLDCVGRSTNKGIVIAEPDRWAPSVLAELETWTERDWRRRTGHLRVDQRSARFQLREVVQPEVALETAFHAFAEATGMEWYQKPNWSVTL